MALTGAERCYPLPVSDIHAPERKIALTVRLTESQIRNLRRLARADDRSVSATARRLIDNGLYAEGHGDTAQWR